MKEYKHTPSIRTLDSISMDIESARLEGIKEGEERARKQLTEEIRRDLQAESEKQRRDFESVIKK